MLRKLFGRQKSSLTSPNYFHCAPKTGSTTLYYLFNQHRDFCAARGKEPNFYSDAEQYVKGEAFFWNERFAHYRGERIAGDFSTSYIAAAKYRASLDRIFANRSPGSTFFSTCIRHPVLWHWSHYLHRVRNVDGFRKLPPVNGTFTDFLKDNFEKNRLISFEAQIRALKEIYAEASAENNLLILVYERDVGPDLTTAYAKICELLSINPANFSPIKGVTSNERLETDEVVSKWRGPGTFALVKANRAYLPSIYQATADGASENGETFSAGDIIIERDPTHISVIRNPDDEAKHKYLDYYSRVSTELTLDQVDKFSERFFKTQLENLSHVLGGEIPEWETERLSLTEVEKADKTFA